MTRALNVGVGAFIPKGSGEADGAKRGLHRMAGDTRPLNLKNVDIKLLAATCYKLRPDLDSWVDACQRGFMRAREALSNIVAARAAALLSGTPPPEGVSDEHSARPCPMAFFSDFAAAAVLEGGPEGAEDPGASATLLGRATEAHDGVSLHRWHALRGVATPLPSIPLLRLLQRAVKAPALPPAMPALFCPRVGLILAYTDDIGAMTLAASPPSSCSSSAPPG